MHLCLLDIGYLELAKEQPVDVLNLNQVTRRLGVAECDTRSNVKALGHTRAKNSRECIKKKSKEAMVV